MAQLQHRLLHACLLRPLQGSLLRESQHLLHPPDGGSGPDEQLEHVNESHQGGEHLGHIGDEGGHRARLCPAAPRRPQHRRDAQVDSG